MTPLSMCRAGVSGAPVRAAWAGALVVVAWLACACQGEPGSRSRAASGRSLAHALPAAPPDAPAPPAPDAPPAAAAPAPAPRITIMAVGDVLFGRYADRETYERVVSTEHGDPFVDVAPILRRADLALANVESPVLVEPEKFGVNARMTFRAEPEDLAWLDAAGFDVLSFANNHALNFGTRGLRETLLHVGRTRLRAVGIGLDQAQADAPVVIDVDGVRVAVLGRTTWLNGKPSPSKHASIAFVSDLEMKARLAADVRAVRERAVADVIVVFIHWGRELAPRAGNHQRWAAQAMIDAGAHLVIGHHPHVVQEVERHGDGLIAYSLGNFLFDNGQIAQRRSVILEVGLAREGERVRVDEVVLHPVLMERATQKPRLARGRDHRVWARLLAALAPGAVIAPDPDAPDDPGRPVEPAPLGP